MEEAPESVAPSPITLVNADGAAPFVLVCEHASNYMPSRYGGLGLPEQELTRHIAWDVGAAELTRQLAARLDAVALLAGASRLLVDCNRPPDSPTLIPEISEIPIPGNKNINRGGETGTYSHLVRTVSRGHHTLAERKKGASAAHGRYRRSQLHARACRGPPANARRRPFWRVLRFREGRTVRPPPGDPSDFGGERALQDRQ